MVSIFFNNPKTVLVAKDIKEAFRYFYSNSRFFVRKNLEDYVNATIWINDKKMYHWSYCQMWDPDNDDYFDVEFDADIVTYYGEYCFNSSLIKEV